ncbi:hypothetical protein BCON_0418g00030 [Botryotinia convoluta]|uniref:Uncharacterized protein n=1 Tax=Botryotinia convoluta TaxID=54673 RepID=A0A4Z1HEJ4_9HELO|nr:hypothetical protein BCON_0418g00030 [Botryotinia convoluta]
MASSEASTISIIEALTLIMAKRKTQEYIDILAKSTTSARWEEEDARSTIALQLSDSLARVLDKMIACRAKGEKDLYEFIEESISMEKACMKRMEDLKKKGETGQNI